MSLSYCYFYVCKIQDFFLVSNTYILLFVSFTGFEQTIMKEV